MPDASAACQLAKVHAAPNAPGSELILQWRLTSAPNSCNSKFGVGFVKLQGVESKLENRLKRIEAMLSKVLDPKQ